MIWRLFAQEPSRLALEIDECVSLVIIMSNAVSSGKKFQGEDFVSLMSDRANIRQNYLVFDTC